MRIIIAFIFSLCSGLPDLLNVRNLSLTGPFLVITSTQGIGLYNLEEKKLKDFFLAENPNYGILSHDYLRIYFIEDKNTLSYYDISGKQKIRLITFDFTPDLLGVSQRSIIVQHGERETLLDLAGFELKLSERESSYIFPANIPQQTYLPPILNPRGERLKFTAILYDDLRGQYIIGTRNFGVYIFDNIRKIYTDSIQRGIGFDYPIIDAMVFGDTMYILSPNYLCTLTDDFKSRLISIPLPSSGEELRGIFMMDGMPCIYTNQGRFFTLRSGVLEFYTNIDMPLKGAFLQGEHLIATTSHEILEMSVNGDTILNINAYGVKKMRPYAKGFAFLKDGKLYLFQNGSLQLISDTTTLHERVEDFEVLRDTIWALTFSHIFKITSETTEVIELPFQAPQGIFISRETIAILKFPFLAIFDGKDYYYHETPALTESPIRVFRFQNYMTFVTPHNLYFCNQY